MAAVADLDGASSAAATSPLSHFPFRSLPPETQLNVFRQIITKPATESSMEHRARKKARSGMLLLDTAAYEMFAAEFFKRATMSFVQPLQFMNTIVRRSSSECLKNLAVISWNHSYTAPSDFKKLWEDIEAWVNIFSTSTERLPALQQIEIVFRDIIERQINAKPFPSFAAHTLDEEGWWRWTSGAWYGFLAELETKLSSNLNGVRTSHKARVTDIPIGGRLKDLRSEQRVEWSANDPMPADAMYVTAGPATVSVSRV